MRSSDYPATYARTHLHTNCPHTPTPPHRLFDNAPCQSTITLHQARSEGNAIDASPLHFTLLVDAGPQAPAEELDALARDLLGELRATDVETAELASAGAAPEGAKSPEAVTLGAVALAVLPQFLPKLVDFVQAWSLRGQGRTVKFKGKVAGQEVEFEGTAADLKAVLAALQAPPAAPAPASAPARSATPG